MRGATQLGHVVGPLVSELGTEGSLACVQSVQGVVHTLYYTASMFCSVCNTMHCGGGGFRYSYAQYHAVKYRTIYFAV